MRGRCALHCRRDAGVLSPAMCDVPCLSCYRYVCVKSPVKYLIHNYARCFILFHHYTLYYYYTIQSLVLSSIILLLLLDVWKGGSQHSVHCPCVIFPVCRV